MCARCYVYNCCVIQEPVIDSQSSEGLKPEKFESDIVFDDIHFSYPARPDVQVYLEYPVVILRYPIVLLASFTSELDSLLHVNNLQDFDVFYSRTR